MTIWRAVLRATIAACLMALFLLGWLLVPRAWVLPAVYGFLIVFIWIDVFVWYYWLKR